MKIEQKIKDIVRPHFLAHSDLVIVEEQRSDNPQIGELLRTAPKRGPMRGFPDFMIRYRENPDFLAVVECKIAPARHASADSRQYDKFAVDGALEHAASLSREFDVLAIGVIGQNGRELRVSHYLHLKGERAPFAFFGDKLLSPDNYLRGYLASDNKQRQDYRALLGFAKQLNKKLHSCKIMEEQRSLLISAILIALKNRSFRASYRKHGNAAQLALALLAAARDEFKNAGLTSKSLDALHGNFGFIATDKSLAQTPHTLRQIIDDVDLHASAFGKTHRFFDMLGQFYIEFLHHANSGKGLGIVLTPRHIAELFADLAQVHKDTVVYDNCTGTGGLLIGAMKKMVDDAGEDAAKIRAIKSSQMVGVEYQSRIYALAVSNMYAHQNGKTGIVNGDCFDPRIMARVKQQRPSVGFLNPPYKSDKKNDADELEFVLNNLECLIEGGVCVAIVPMQSALATRGKTAALKAELLQKHTLKAVLSMPDELFFNSDVGVVTCVMVFVAHRPHAAGMQTYFAYCKNDGHVKRKNQGRINAMGKWEDIKEKWLSGFLNLAEQAGLSINKEVSAAMEWAAEAYMETDYSAIANADFEKNVRDYVAYLFSNNMLNSISSDCRAVNRVELECARWQWFALSDLFDIVGSKTTPIGELRAHGAGEYPYITTQASNNGANGFFDFFTEAGGAITVDSAVAGYCAYQALPFSASDHVEKLIPKFAANQYLALFFVTLLNREQYRFNYGRKCSQSRLRQMKIRLPEKNGRPDFSAMEKFIQSLPYSANL